MEKISWRAPEHIYTEKTADWYWVVGIVTLSVALISIILNNLVFAILIIVSAATLSLFATKRPRMIPIELSPNGVSVDTTFYPYADLESFWVETEHWHPRIFLKSTKNLSPFIVIFLNDADPGEIHHALSQHLTERKHSEPLLEKVLIYLGF